MTWQVGDAIGAYKIKKILGSGGMATVYLADHERLAREVAIKTLHPVYVTDENFLTRFEREARIVASLEHPNIVPIHDFAEQDGQPYLVMKYISGQTLKDMFEKRSPSLDEIKQIINAVASALSYAHEQGVLHRDIKPSNILIDSEGTPYITDFGLARLLQSGETSLSAGMIIGTPNYLSPEQASDEGEVTARSDVYSLGIVLYEMIVGQVPFQSKTPYATVHKHIYEAPPLPSELNPEVPTQVEMVLLKALEKDPDSRYQTPQELAAAFEEAVKTSGLTVLSPDRSSALMTRELPSVSSPKPSPMPVSKPKREPPYTPEPLLLLDGEESWADYPREEIIRRRLKKRRDELMGFVFHLLPYLGVNAMIIFGTMADGDFGLGAFITALAWGAGLAAHGINTFQDGKQQTEKLYSNFDEHMSEYYGYNWRSTIPDAEIQREWRFAKERHKEQKEFRIHGAIYAMINTMLWFIWGASVLENQAFNFPWPLFVTGGWMVGLIGHGMQVNGKKQNYENDERIQAELAMMGGSTDRLKRKNETLEDQSPHTDGVRLTEDGELTDSMVTEFEEEQRRNRHR